MLISYNDLLSNEQAITVDAVSTKTRDLIPNGGAVNAGDTGGPTANSTVNIGAGNPLYLYILVTTTFAKGGANPTLTVTLESDSAVSLDSSATVHATVASAVAEATLVAGYWIAKGFPIPQGNYERYVGLRYTTNTDDFDTGKLSAWLSPIPYSNDQYYGATKTGVS